ncbi:hypothetical protein F4780DRAFT_798176 [Xylariomycetidae sp. FL0641]|nr:hypothetical protein F4780DRAFT_798176 [Xylariomycetidae sp. FL0641]
MPIQFIDHAHTDQTTKRLVRSHAAKGKNLGRKLNRPSRVQRAKAVVARDKSIIPSTRDVGPVESIERAHPDARIRALATVDRPFGDEFFAVPFAYQSRTLLQKACRFVAAPLYPPALGAAIVVERARNHWGELMFEDETFFHGALALFVATASAASLTPAEQLAAAQHLSRTLALVGARLGGADALSDRSLATVVALTMIDRLRGAHRAGLVHLDGLARMVALRGGLPALVRHRPAIARKVLHADLEFALALGAPARYPLALVPGAATLAWLRARAPGPGEEQEEDEVRDLLRDARAVAWLVNNSPDHGVRLPAPAFYDVLVLLGHRLVAFRALCRGPPRRATHSQTDAALHLALIAFLTTFFFSIGRRRMSIPLLAPLLHDALRTWPGADGDARDLEMALWILCTAKSAAFAHADEDVWLAPKLMLVAQRLELRSWTEVIEKIFGPLCTPEYHRHAA